MDGPPTARDLITAARRDVLDVDVQAARKERRAKRVYALAVALAVGLGLAAIIIAVASATTRAQDVVGQLTPEVARQVVADARAQRVVNARGVLAAANRELVRQGLPMVADPGPSANAEQVIAAANLAQILALLPREATEPLRDRPGGVLVLPTMQGTVIGPGSVGADAGAPGATPGPTAPPGGSGGRQGAASAPGGSGSRPPSGGGESGPSASPPSQGGGGGQSPPRTTRRLLPQLVPLPIPLIGT